MKRFRPEEFDFALDKSVPITNDDEDNSTIYNPTILLNDLPKEIVSLIIDYLLHIKDGFSFISTCSAFREVLNHHELFIEYRLNRELDLLIKREESSIVFRENRNRINVFSTKLSNVSKLIEVKQIRDSKLEDWRKIVNQYREPYRKAIWKYLLNRVSYHSPTLFASGVSVSLTNETKDCQFYIDNVLIKCCEISYHSHNLMAFHNGEAIELVNEQNYPKPVAVKKFKEIIGITESKVGKNIYKMFSTSTVLNLLIASLPNAFHFIHTIEDDLDSSGSDEENDFDGTNDEDEYDDDIEYELVDQHLVSN
ncbi:hypothetical protein NAEGRDRAFT_46026 [Naegleria gruberi]|uniref:F-box domain-containing protein n=1 Tax=Naegleria gruberi TaxID=5762 RepID=D2V195_NAEGR|nr:uncharacterized protein NAEGRDRAFT_46026 [Naegleria gruberi]EFC49430.1 hypothetical protein NAEGRDRAFT_46026 [Naegleria gruberi]|eukprot:XP_002682174.1 hypothetical protein NAEGRDRAFT_46026 [Naegleria gruberi strain NEG-M]